MSLIPTKQTTLVRLCLPGHTNIQVILMLAYAAMTLKSVPWALPLIHPKLQ